jgi:hypothetical protein
MPIQRDCNGYRDPPPDEPVRAARDAPSRAAAALRANDLRETGIAATVCCSGWFGGIRYRVGLVSKPIVLKITATTQRARPHNASTGRMYPGMTNAKIKPRSSPLTTARLSQ